MEGEFKAFCLAPGRQSWLPVLMYMVGLISKLLARQRLFYFAAILRVFFYLVVFYRFDLFSKVP